MSEARRSRSAKVDQAGVGRRSPSPGVVAVKRLLIGEAPPGFRSGRRAEPEARETRVPVFENGNRWVADVGPTCLSTVRSSSSRGWPSPERKAKVCLHAGTSDSYGRTGCDFSEDSLALRPGGPRDSRMREQARDGVRQKAFRSEMRSPP